MSLVFFIRISRLVKLQPTPLQSFSCDNFGEMAYLSLNMPLVAAVAVAAAAGRFSRPYTDSVCLLRQKTDRPQRRTAAEVYSSENMDDQWCPPVARNMHTN